MSPQTKIKSVGFQSGVKDYKLICTLSPVRKQGFVRFWSKASSVPGSATGVIYDTSHAHIATNGFAHSNENYLRAQSTP